MIDSKRRLATLTACLALGFGGLGVAGCGDDDEGPAEEAGQELDQAGEEVGEELDQAGEDVEQAAEDEDEGGSGGGY